MTIHVCNYFGVTDENFKKDDKKNLHQYSITLGPKNETKTVFSKCDNLEELLIKPTVSKVEDIIAPGKSGDMSLVYDKYLEMLINSNTVEIGDLKFFSTSTLREYRERVECESRGEPLSCISRVTGAKYGKIFKAIKEIYGVNDSVEISKKNVDWNKIEEVLCEKYGMLKVIIHDIDISDLWSYK